MISVTKQVLAMPEACSCCLVRHEMILRFLMGTVETASLELRQLLRGLKTSLQQSGNQKFTLNTTYY